MSHHTAYIAICIHTLYNNPCCHRNVAGPLLRREYLLTAMRVKAVMRRQALLLAICKLERRGLSHLPCVLYAPLLNCTAPSCCCITHIMCNRSWIDVLLYCIVHTRRHRPGSVSSRRAAMYSYIWCFFATRLQYPAVYAGYAHTARSLIAL